MTVTINDSQIQTIADVAKLVSGSFALEITAFQRKEAYNWIENTLIRFSYYKLNKLERGLVRQYIMIMTGYSKSQVTRLIKQQLNTGRIKENYPDKKPGFEQKYLDQDIRLLAKTDRLHNYPNGNVIKKILQRMATNYCCLEFYRLANISVAHIYNLRKTTVYQRINNDYDTTKKTTVAIGERRKPVPNGQPGFIRVDTCHQGDQDGIKGVYHVNLIDEVTQWQVVIAVEKISENHLIPALKIALELFPFTIINFHTDNGSEYINQHVARLLNKLLIEQTKSRSRKTNDNALVEGKNNAIRKWIGYSFIPQKFAKIVNQFYLGSFIEYLNYHKPCAFAKEIADKQKRGKIRKVYKLEDYQTPFEKLKSIVDTSGKGTERGKKHLRLGVSIKQLEGVAKKHTDNQMAEIVQKQREEMNEQLYN